MTRIIRLCTSAYEHIENAYNEINHEVRTKEVRGYTILSVQIIQETYDPTVDCSNKISYTIVYRKPEEDAFA